MRFWIQKRPNDANELLLFSDTFINNETHSNEILHIRMVTNKNIKLSSLKISENTQKKEGGPDRSVSDNQQGRFS